MNQHPTFIRHIRHIALAASMVCLGATALAAPEAQFQPAFKQFIQASSGDTAAIGQAADAFADLLKSEPTNPVLMAYSGSATAMKAGTTMLPWKKMTYAEDGLAQLDKALAMLSPAHDAPVQHGTPGVLEVKFVASNTFLAVPGFMNRNERGAKLLGEVVDSPLLATAPLPFKGSVWLSAAKEASKAKNTAEAKRYLDLIVQQQAPQAPQAQTLLKNISSS
ncbi:MAG: hypothetical protein V4627_11240 [Pseudomonadota bacterium]